MKNPVLRRLHLFIVSIVYRKDIQRAAMDPENYAAFLHYVETVEPESLEQVRELIHAQM